MPKMEKSDRFQGLCLEERKGAGTSFIHVYDSMPPEAREMARTSPFNLCAACILSQARIVNHNRSGSASYILSLQDYQVAITKMEEMIRCEEIE